MCARNVARVILATCTATSVGSFFSSSWLAGLQPARPKAPTAAKLANIANLFCFMRVGDCGAPSGQSFGIHRVNAQFGGLTVSLRHGQKKVVEFRHKERGGRALRGQCPPGQFVMVGIDLPHHVN